MRRWCSSAVLMTLAVVAVLGRGCSLSAGENPPPNIVMIISDDQAWTDYGFMGHPHIQTPNIDKLAAESRTFRRGYCPSSLCCPSLVSIITGLQPHRHRITSNDPPKPAGAAGKKAGRANPEYLAGREAMVKLMDQSPTLPKLLKDRGYLSLQTGKWWQGNFTRGGFTHGMTDGDSKSGGTGGRHGDKGLEIGRVTMQPIFDFVAEAKTQQKPFFVWYAPMLPHDPHTPPDRLLQKYKAKTESIHVAKYWAMVEWFDETIGALLKHLDEQGLRENTIVVYVTDNGWIQNPDAPRYAPRSKQSQYDGGIRTPILVRWPAKAPAADVKALASSLDLFPTLLKAAGATVPGDLEGIDLFDDAALQKRTQIFGGIFTHDAVELAKPERSLRWRWCIEGDWKLIVPDGTNEKGPVELYNLTADPHEKENLAEKDAQKAAALKAVLDGWWNPFP